MRGKQLGILGGLLIAMTMFTTNLFASEIEIGVVTQKSSAYYSADVLGEKAGYVFEGESLTIVEEVDGFYGVLLEEDELVYIEKSCLQVEQLEEEKDETEEVTTTNEVVNEPQPVKEEVAPVPKKEEVKISKGEEVVAYAKQFIGTPYRSGGNSLTKGVDCSGFTQQVFLKFGVKLQRSSRSQYASNGKKVTKDQLQSGDLVFYGYNGSVNHVAIYIGNGQIIHAPVPGKSVCIEPLWQRGCAPIIGYKRVV